LLQDQASKFKQKSSLQAFQQILFEMYDAPLPGKLNLPLLDDIDGDVDETDDFPDALTMYDQSSFVQTGTDSTSMEAPDAGTPNKASNNQKRKRCSGITAKPKCENILDKLDQMWGEMNDALAKATKELNVWDKKCEREIAEINAEITGAKDIIAVNTKAFDEASAFHNGMFIEFGKQKVIKEELCRDLRKKFTECYKKLKDLEREWCGLIKIRQQVYNKVVNPDKKKPELIIQDCMMTDWVVGPCSATCLDRNGGSGIQIISREPQNGWDNTTEEGKYGSSCPPGEVDRECATIPCPIDCKMKEWSEWSECTAECGGGSESRSRGVLRAEQHGGEACPAATESDSCNTGSCDVDCVLADWGAWSPCTKSCKYKWNAKPGHQWRTKKIATPRKGAGFCPNPGARGIRYELQRCNDFVCPKTLKCVANIDIVFVQDGSGSLWYRWGGWANIDLNFKNSKKFVQKLISYGDFATMDDDLKVSDGLRAGWIVYSWRPTVHSQITTDKKALIAKIDASKWPRGGTMTGRALLKAKQLFIAPGSSKRMQLVMLITDGRASNRAWAEEGARQVRKAGIKILVVAVKGAVRDPQGMCRMASQDPSCGDWVIATPKWSMLQSRLLLYVTTFCPTLEDPTVS